MPEKSAYEWNRLWWAFALMLVIWTIEQLLETRLDRIGSGVFLNVVFLLMSAVYWLLVVRTRQFRNEPVDRGGGQSEESIFP